MTLPPFIFRHTRHLVRRILLVALGFAVGQSYRTLDVYRQSGGGDIIDVPDLTFAGIFDLGLVSISYPAGWRITAGRPRSGYPSTSAWLSAEWGLGGSLTINCVKGKPDTGHGMIRSKYNPNGDELVMQSGTRQVDIMVSHSGDNAILGPNSVATLLTFMVETQFPYQVSISAKEGPDQKLKRFYDIPTVGVQNVAATISRNGNPPQPIPEPPSDPFRVMKRWCGPYSMD